MVRRFTPVDIVVLLEIHYRPHAYSEANSPAENNAIAKWLKYGLIETEIKDYKTTHLGEVFIEKLCNVDLPVINDNTRLHG